MFLWHRDPLRKEPVTSLSNAQLLCNHGGLVHRPSPDADSDPDDKAVSNALDKAAGAIDAATVHQASDNAPEPRKQRHKTR